MVLPLVIRRTQTPDEPSIFSCSAINTELFTLRLQLPKFCPFVPELKVTFSLPGAKVPGNESSTERKFHPMEPRSESSSIRFLGSTSYRSEFRILQSAEYYNLTYTGASND